MNKIPAPAALQPVPASLHATARQLVPARLHASARQLVPARLRASARQLVPARLRAAALLTLSALLLIPAGAMAQTTDDDSDFRTRTSVGVDWKIKKGLHLEAGYELRTADQLSRIDRNQLNVGVTYSPVKHLDLGAGYYFIGNYDSEQELKPRHRVYVDATGSYKFGAWKLALTERLQMTNSAYEFNKYQRTPNLVELKSKLKLSYTALAHIKPYAYAELRNCFNGPDWTTGSSSASSSSSSSASFQGYSDCYVNRIRGALGLKWDINKTHALDFRFMADRCSVKDIDSNAKGTKLKSLDWDKSTNLILAIGYTISL